MVAAFGEVLAGLALMTLSPSGLTVLAAVVLVGAVFLTLACVARVSRVAAALPLRGRAAALREKSWCAAFLRQRDPDARGRVRPRAPSAAPAAAG